MINYKPYSAIAEMSLHVRIIAWLLVIY